jgi:hypothetical protein
VTEWWPDNAPVVGDLLASDLAAVAAPGMIADAILYAACAEVVRQVRAGETTYVCVLADAVRTADLILEPPS